MDKIIIRSAGYIIMICLGILSKKKGLFKVEDRILLSRLSLYITMPMAILASFRGFKFEVSLIAIILFGFVINVVLAFVSLIFSRKDTPSDRAMKMLNNSSHNIGSFVLPYLTGFYEPSAMIYSSMYDVGNSFYSMGINLGIAEIISGKQHKFEIKSFLKTVFSTPPFVMYIIMTFIVILRIPVPGPVFEIAGMIGSANVFIVMFMFGIMFETKTSKHSLKKSAVILVMRYLSAAGVALLIWTFFPIPELAKQVLTIAVFAPMSSVIPTFCMNLDCDRSVYSFVSSLSVLISIVINTVLIASWQ